MTAQSHSNGASGAQAQDMAFLALSAAIQLNKLLSEKTSDTSTVDRFVSILAKTPGLDKNMEIRHLAKDPQAISLYSNALRSFAPTSNNFIDSISALSRIISDLNAEDHENRRKAQEAMRKFCLALHSHILASRHPVEELDHLKL